MRDRHHNVIEEARSERASSDCNLPQKGGKSNGIYCSRPRRTAVHSVPSSAATATKPANRCGLLDSRPAVLAACWNSRRVTYAVQRVVDMGSPSGLPEKITPTNKYLT